MHGVGVRTRLERDILGSGKFHSQTFSFYGSAASGFSSCLDVHSCVVVYRVGDFFLDEVDSIWGAWTCVDMKMKRLLPLGQSPSVLIHLRLYSSVLFVLRAAHSDF